jgi:hypothetical protein
MAEYRRRRSTVKSLVDTFENGVSSSPRKAGRRVTPSKSPRNDNRKSVPSPKTLPVDSEKGGRRLMSEDEVSSLVHSALLRARLATSSFSPRARSTLSPLSQSSTSPRGTGSTGHTKRPTSSPSPRKSTLDLNVPDDEDTPGPNSLSRRSQRTIYATPKSRAGESSVYSFDGFQSPEHAEVENMEVEINTFSLESTTYDQEGDTMTDEEDELGPNISSVNSSEAIIRRVEEEIANARRAAQEANRRLAGVSANLKDAKAAAMEGAAKLVVESAKDSTPKKSSGESRNPSPSVNPFCGEEDGSTQAIFDSAMDVIGEEFERNESNDDSKKLDLHIDDDAMSVEKDPVMTTSAEKREAHVTSTEPLLDSPNFPADEFVTERKRDEHCILGDQVPLSPSEEIDSLLWSNSNDITDSVAVGARQRTANVATVDTISEDSLEEILTPRAKGRLVVSPIKHPNKDTLDRKAQRDEAALLALASIDDDASIANEEIRASRDSAFDDNMADDDLLAWLPIEDSLDNTEEEAHSFHDNEVPVDEVEAGKKAQVSSETFGDDKNKETEGNRDSHVVENSTNLEIVAPKVTFKQDPVDEGKNGTEHCVDFDEKEQQPKPDSAIDHSTESQIVLAVAKFGEDNVTGDEMGPTSGNNTESKSRPFAETQTLASSEDLSSKLVVENKGERSQLTRRIPSSVVEETESATGKGEGDPAPKSWEQDMTTRDTKSDVIIYQVVSVGSTDAAGTARHPMDPSDDRVSPMDDGANIFQSRLQPSLSTQDVIVDEAIEVVVEPFHFNASDQDEQVNRMNASVSTESHFEESSEEESIEKFRDCQESDEEKIADGSDENNVSIPGSKPETSEGDKDFVQQVVIDSKVIKAENGGTPMGLQSYLEEKVVDYDSSKEVMVDEGEKDQEKDVHNNNDDNTSTEDDQTERLMNNSERESEETSEDTGNSHPRSTKAEEKPPIEHHFSMSSANPSSPPSSIVPSIFSHSPVPQAPSPRQLALVENRRAAQAKEDQARNAMCGESTGPTGLPNPEKEIVHRVKRVKFKQRYPVPPQIKRPLRAAEIVFNNQTLAPKDKLHLSRPSKDLKELLEAAIGSSIQRRSNAFGALKVLSTQKLNKMTLVRTKGFLDSIVFAINDNVSSFEDTEAAVASRTRAVSVILNVAEMKDNRCHVLAHPGLANCLVKCIVEDKGEGRAIACSVLATVAKSRFCREPMATTHKLVDTLSIILKGEEPASFSNNEQNYIQEEKKDYSGDDEASRTVASNSYSSGSAASHSSVGSSNNSETRNRARLSACAALVHLSKECSVAQKMGTSTTLLHCVVASCNETDNPLHTKCLEVLANMSRFPHNNGVMTTYPGLVDTLIMNGNHKNDIDRLWSMRTLQNLSSDPSSKTILATGTVLELLSVNIMRQKYDEQLAATAAVHNLATEPGAVVPLTNTKNVVATLVHVAHNPTSSNDVRLMACDTLATLGLWLQTLAGAGTVPPGVDPVPLPTYITSGWKRWEK